MYKYTINKVRRQINPKLQIDGILLTMVDSRTNFAKEISALLRETYGSKIKVFTSEIPHSKGNFGTAWQNQQREFEDIPAPVLFTTNCIMPLRPSYADRVFTTSVVSYPGVTHIGEDRDFSPVIAKALELGGYPEDTLIPGMNGGSVVIFAWG